MRTTAEMPKTPAARRRRSTRKRRPERIDGYAPIGDYAAIGDGRTVALVAADGAIDWLTLPTMASQPVFGAILDAERGGSFTLGPTGEAAVRRRYLPETNVLETTFEAAGGNLRVTDALTTDDGGQLPWVELVRSVECTRGEVVLEWSVTPRFGEREPGGRIGNDRGVPTVVAGASRLALHAWDAGEPQLAADRIAGSATLRQGERALLVLVFVDAGPIPAPSRHDVERRLDGTVAWWRRWVERHEYDGPWPDEVARSALALRLMTHTSGALLAAPTTSLPEQIGGDRNWDYRFSWVRDSSFALDALLRIGRLELVQSVLHWLLDAASRTHPRLNVLYELDGSMPRACRELPLPGYRGSSPVRDGNSAASQTQLGCYGDLLETVWLYVQEGNLLGPDVAQRIAEVASFVCEIWENEDAGIWELDENRHYTISKMGCWLALDRALRMAECGAIPGDDADRWRRERERVRDFVETRCWSERRRSYTFYADTDELDASVLLAAWTGFADPKGERMAGTIAAVREELAEGPAVFRYTGARTIEGAFLACSFWLVQALALAGRLDEATELMEGVLALSNDVGLFAEEVDPFSRELLGNFPQGLTHLALISAAGVVKDMTTKEDEE